MPGKETGDSGASLHSPVYPRTERERVRESGREWKIERGAEKGIKIGFVSTALIREIESALIEGLLFTEAL